MNIHLHTLSLAKQTISRVHLIESFKTAVFVGIILNLINNSSAYTYGEEISGYNILLNFIVPFLVSTYSRARASYMSHRETPKKPNIRETGYKTTSI